MTVRLEVSGTPAPKGSSRAFITRGRAPKAVLAPSGSDQNKAALHDWDQAVKLAANRATRGRGPVFVDTALAVTAVFRIARPAGHRGKRGLKPSASAFPVTKPDLDKLARATLDSLHGTVYDDDSRIVTLTLGKCYATPGTEGATIVVEAAAGAVLMGGET